MGRVRIFIIDAGGREGELDARALEYIRGGSCPACGGELVELCKEPEIGYESYACRSCKSLIYIITVTR